MKNMEVTMRKSDTARRAVGSQPSAFSFQPSAFCLLLTASWLLLPAACLLPSAYGQDRNPFADPKPAPEEKKDPAPAPAAEEAKPAPKPAEGPATPPGGRRVPTLKPPGAGGEEDAELTPEEILKRLQEARDLMFEAEELLSKLGKEGAPERMRRAGEKLDPPKPPDDPSSPSGGGAGGAQSDAMKKLDDLLRGTEKAQQDTVERLNGLLQKLAQMEQQQQGQPQPGGQRPQGPKPQPLNPDNDPQSNPGKPAEKPYDPPKRTPPPLTGPRSSDPAGAWGNLPPRLRDQILQGERDVERFPEEYRELLREYFKRLAEEDR